MHAPLFTRLRDAIAIECIDVADRSDALFAEERLIVAAAAARRRAQFSSGRHAAHLLMHRLGGEPAAVLSNARAPVWPAPWIGSISHTDAIAVAALARRAEVRALGIDVERAGRMSSRLLRHVLTPAEIARCAAGSDLDAALMIFSAKEALYKAVRAEAGGYVGFHDVEIDLADETFVARAVGGRAPADLIALGTGLHARHQGFVATLFWVPNDA